MTTERETASAVADPSLPARVRQLLTSPPSGPARRRPRRARRRGIPLRLVLVAPDWLLGCTVIAVAVVATAATIPGRALVVLLMLAMAAFVVHKTVTPPPWKTAARYRSRYQGRFVDPSCIAQPYRRQLARAQGAIRDVLQSAVYRDGAIDDAVSGAILAEHEWDIACLLRDATALHRQSALIGSAAAAAHPAVQNILAQHAEVLGRVGRAVERRVQDLEAYAAVIRAANREYSTWLLTAAAAALNDPYLDLLAAAPAHGRRGQIARLAREARARAVAFRGLLEDPTANPPLALPDQHRSDAA